VAVKLMHPRVQDDPDLITRFRREADVVSRLDHPCIVRLLDQGAADEDGPYIVFELVDGTTLKALIRQRGALDPAEAASITSQVARGLELAHRSGIVHRDIKSHNILVTDAGVAKLTDFGIARLLDGMQDGLTRTGTVLGTSDYLAPEQARGLGVDGRTDVYALGVVLYEGLTGELPFPADTPMAVALRQVRDETALGGLQGGRIHVAPVALVEGQRLLLRQRVALAMPGQLPELRIVGQSDGRLPVDGCAGTRGADERQLQPQGPRHVEVGTHRHRGLAVLDAMQRLPGDVGRACHALRSQPQGLTLRAQVPAQALQVLRGHRVRGLGSAGRHA